MNRCFKYSVAQFRADRSRDERLNLALIIFDGRNLDVRLPKSLDKIKAISAALDVDSVRGAISAIPDLDAYLIGLGMVAPEDRVAHLNELAAISLSPLGEFYAASAAAYHQCAERLLVQLVEPEPAPVRATKRRSTRLFSEIKTAFRAERVLARKGEGIETHRVVANHKLAEGLAADLILKNGAMHVVQTVDASSDIPSMRPIAEIAISALVFEQARMSFGDVQTKSRLVYKASSTVETHITPSLEAAEHQGAELVNWESRDDRTKFIVEISSLAEPVASSKKGTGNLHASTQHRFKLN